jgi:predicted Fe-S protein YdhL (DUF1289 family)
LTAADKPAAPPAPVPTPCIDVCTMDEAAGLCLGCARTAEEIGAWLEADAGFKRAVWDALPARRARLPMPAHRLPWTAAESAEFMEAALRSGAGRWRVGIHGAAADFAVGPDERAEIISDADAITAVSPRGALRLLKHPKTIAIAFGHRVPPAAIDLREKAPSPGRLRRPPSPARGEGSVWHRFALSPRGRGRRGPEDRSRVRGLFTEPDSHCDAGEIPLRRPGRPQAEPGSNALSAYAEARCEASGPRLGGRGDAEDEAGVNRPQAIAFVLPRGRVRLEKSASLTQLGPDRDAILEQHRDTVLYDTGLGARLAARICLRTADSGLAACYLTDSLTTDGLDIVIETGLGRAELFAPADPRWLDTHHLAASRETPPGWDLRPAFALGALFYPGRG